MDSYSIVYSFNLFRNFKEKMKTKLSVIFLLLMFFSKNSLANCQQVDKKAIPWLYKCEIDGQICVINGGNVGVYCFNKK